MNPRQLFIQDPVSKTIRFTRTGFEVLEKKFALAGYNIKNIRTMAEFKVAVDASFALEMQELAATTKGKHTALDKTLEGLPGWD